MKVHFPTSSPLKKKLKKKPSLHSYTTTTTTTTTAATTLSLSLTSLFKNSTMAAAAAQHRDYEETFKKGTTVEVSSEDEGLRGSWYTATVLRTISRKTLKILVEYHNLFADDAGSKPLREFVDAILVRPIPPREHNLVFSLMDDVDAFHNDGWWEGVVTQVLLDSSRFFYSVFFRCSREQIVFSSSDLRLHREWVRGNLWVPPLLHLSSPHPPSGQRKRSGEDGRRGSQERAIRDGGGRDVRRRSGSTPTKHGGFAANGGMNGTGNGCVDDEMVVTKGKDGKLKLCTNGVTNERGPINGTPPRRASNHAGTLVCCLKSATGSYGKIKQPRRSVSNHAGSPLSKR